MVVAGRGFDVPGAKPAGLSYMRPAGAPVKNPSRVLLSTPISIGAVKGDHTSGPPYKKGKVRGTAITYASCHKI
jgi:hypothetical protein